MRSETSFTDQLHQEATKYDFELELGVSACSVTHPVDLIDSSSIAMETMVNHTQLLAHTILYCATECIYAACR